MIALTYLNYIKINAVRCLKSYKIWGGIAGVFLSLLFATLENKNDSNSIVFMVGYIIDGIPFYLCMVFCAVPYAGSISEDMAFDFHKLQIIRQNLKAYIVTKVIVIFFSAIIAMMLGFLLFVAVLKLRLPWVMVNDSLYDILIERGGLKSLLINRKFIMYYLLVSVQLGMFSGCLSLTATVFSLFVKNRLLVYSVPVMVLYLIINFAWRIPTELAPLNLYKVFIPFYNVYNHDVWSFIWSVFIGLLTACFLGAVIFYKVRRAVRNG